MENAMELLHDLQSRMALGQRASAGLQDMEDLLAGFRAARETAWEVARKNHRGAGNVKLHITSPGDAPPRGSSALLPSLRPISLREMTVGRKHEGRVLHGTLIETPFKMTGIITILQDGNGDAVAVSIYHAMGGSVSRSAVESLYPKGMKVAVKEPYFKVGSHRQLVVRVDNPADIVDYSLAQEGQDAGALGSVESLREEGRRYFSEEQWDKAIDVYSKCISVLEVRSKGDETVSEQCVIAYSNRAEAWLRLEQHANALHDAVKALERDAGHTKSTVRKAKALCGLQCYQEAIACLLNLLKRKPPLQPETRAWAKETLKEAQVSDKQSRFGIYNLDAYYRGKCGESAPKCSDFVGAVEVRKVGSGNPAAGRGLFTTKEVKAGELLLVSNALAVAKDDSQEFGLTYHAEFSEKKPMTIVISTTEDLVAKLVGRCRMYPRQRLQLFSLSDSTPASMSKVPPMSLFTPPVDSKQVVATSAKQNVRKEVDVARIRRIVETNAFYGEQPRGSRVAPPSGLWVLPSLINHSCVPNAKCSVVGDALFLRAIRDIEQGQEITILYCGRHHPVHVRNRIFSAHFQFECCCPRCSFEKSLGERFPRLIKLAEEFAEFPPKEDSSLAVGKASSVPASAACPVLAAAGAKIATAVDEILQELPADDADKKDWIRASFLQAYICKASQHMRVAMGTQDWESWARAMTCVFDTMLSILPDELVLSYVGTPIHRLPVPPHWRTKWTQLAKKICTLMYGTMEESTVKALVKKFAEIQMLSPTAPRPHVTVRHLRWT